MAFIILILDGHMATATAAAIITSARTLSRAVVTYQDGYRPNDHRNHDAQDYDIPNGHSATASCSVFLFWKKGSFEMRRYPRAITEMMQRIIPDTTGDSPAIRLPSTYTTDATA